MLADKLNMSPEEAERWIVNLIRNARLDAKIDSKLVRLPTGDMVCVCVCVSADFQGTLGSVLEENSLSVAPHTAAE